MHQESRRLLVDFIAIFVGFTGYLIARATCATTSGNGCANSPILQAVFIVGLSMIVVAVLIMTYERVVWKRPKLDIDGEGAQEET